MVAYALFAVIAARDASAVLCSGASLRPDNVTTGTALSGYASKITNADLFQNTTLTSALVGQRLWGSAINAFANAGEACTNVATAFVYMDLSEYEYLRSQMLIVAKLQEGFDLGVIAVVIAALLAGFWFGWKAVQRGSSQ